LAPKASSNNRPVILGDQCRGRQGSRSFADPGSRRARSVTVPNIGMHDWKDILVQLYNCISEDRILANAAAVSFYALLAIFPGLAALVSIYGLFADPGAIDAHLSSLVGILPGGAVDVLRDQLTRLAAQGGATLGISFVFSLAVSLWSANGGIKALIDALNVAYEEREERGFVEITLTSLALTIGIIGFLLVALACVVAAPAVLRRLPPSASSIIDIGRWPVLLVLVAAASAVIFRYGPDRKQPHWRWISWGSAFAAPAWLVASLVFSWYAANFGSFNKTYGSLGAVVGFMIWMWISVIVILIGAKLNALIERRTLRNLAR
jgi:membrane protein